MESRQLRRQCLCIRRHHHFQHQFSDGWNGCRSEKSCVEKFGTPQSESSTAKALLVASSAPPATPPSRHEPGCTRRLPAPFHPGAPSRANRCHGQDPHRSTSDLVVAGKVKRWSASRAPALPNGLARCRQSPCDRPIAKVRVGAHHFVREFGPEHIIRSHGRLVLGISHNRCAHPRVRRTRHSLKMSAGCSPRRLEVLERDRSRE